MIQFIHISDTHFGPSKETVIRGCNSFEKVSQLVDEINCLPFDLDFVVHTGDIVNDPDDDAYQIAESVLSGLKAPVHYVSGNHDCAYSTRQFMSGAEHTPLLEGGDKLAYSFPMGSGVTGVVFDAWVPPNEGPHGYLGQDQVTAFSHLLESTGDRFALFLHYPMIPIGSPWIDDFLLVKNGESIHSFLAGYAERICGVFFGHLHRGLQLFRDGILYSGVSSPVCHFSCGPHETEGCMFDANCSLPFNHVSISGSATMIKEYAIPTV